MLPSAETCIPRNLYVRTDPVSPLTTIPDLSSFTSNLYFKHIFLNLSMSPRPFIINIPSSAYVTKSLDSLFHSSSTLHNTSIASNGEYPSPIGTPEPRLLPFLKLDSPLWLIFSYILLNHPDSPPV